VDFDAEAIHDLLFDLDTAADPRDKTSSLPQAMAPMSDTQRILPTLRPHNDQLTDSGIRRVPTLQ
jgi:hypothetical protein